MTSQIDRISSIRILTTSVWRMRFLRAQTILGTIPGTIAGMRVEVEILRRIAPHRTVEAWVSKEVLGGSRPSPEDMREYEIRWATALIEEFKTTTKGTTPCGH